MSKSKPQKKDTLSESGQVDGTKPKSSRWPRRLKDADEKLSVPAKQKSKPLRDNTRLNDGCVATFLGSAPEGSEASAFGMHPDAGINLTIPISL
jgi:hypothetical protein